jgi:aerobic C4-dicarboxylate transport protein
MTVNKISAVPARRVSLGPLWLQVLIGMALGILAGILLPHEAVALRPLGDLFVRMIRMTLPPLMFLSITIGIARLGDLRKVGRIGAKTLVYFEVVSTLALVIGLAGTLVLRPGVGMNVNPATFDMREIADYAAVTVHHGAADLLMSIVPMSIAGAFVSGNMLQIVFLSVLLGLALAQFREHARPLLDLMDLCLRGVFGIVGFIMYAAPIAIFGAIAFTIGQFGVGTLMPLAKFVADIWIVCTIFIAVVLGLAAQLAGINLVKLLRYIQEEIVITLGSSCSEAVMAPLMVKMEKLGCERSIVEMVFPTSYAFNADGTAAFVSMGAIFIAQATNTHLAAHDIAVLLLTMMLVSKGISGVTSAGVVVLAAALATVHQIPLAGLVLLLGVERLTTPVRAVLNIIGNSVATIVIARWEGAYDVGLAERMLNGHQEQNSKMFKRSR